MKDEHLITDDGAKTDMKPCILCQSKDEQIKALKDMSQELDDRLTRSNNAIEFLIKKNCRLVCRIVDYFNCDGIDCETIDCHTKLFNELLKRGQN
jgi:hypothetical protein